MVNTMPQTGKTNLERLFHYWGKAGEEDKDYHLLVYHCLDVAACGVMLLRLTRIFHQKERQNLFNPL